MKHSTFKSSGSGRITQAAVSRIQSATARSHNGVVQSGRNFHDTDSYGRDDLPLVAKLEQQGLIKAEWGVTDSNRQARFYEITAAGRRRLVADKKAWDQMVAVMHTLFADPA